MMMMLIIIIMMKKKTEGDEFVFLRVANLTFPLTSRDTELILLKILADSRS